MFICCVISNNQNTSIITISIDLNKKYDCSYGSHLLWGN